MRGIDIRRTGSGNIGAVNVFRSAGPVWGVLTFALDGLKGFVPTLVAISLIDLHAGLLATICAILGHTFTPYLGFRGGKGVATGLGGFLAITPIGVGLGALCWIVVVLITGYASLGSMFGALVVAVFLALTRNDLLVILAGLLIFILIVLRHRANIKRLLMGTENKLKLGRRT
jgi:glycerol-3-phosphate acyltransferase PlsY